MGLVYSEPACQAAYDGDVQRLYQVLKLDPAQLDAQDRHTGDTPLIAACRRGHEKVVQYLLDNRADPQRTNEKHRTCLHYVCRRSFSLMDYILIAILMPILLLGYFFMLQRQRQSISLLKTVLSSKVDVNAIDYKGNLALHYAVQRKHLRLVEQLLQRNADVNHKNNDGETPLDVAVRLKFNKMVALMRKHH